MQRIERLVEWGAPGLSPPRSTIVSRVGLPDVDRLLSLSPEMWRTLGRRLRAIGVDQKTVSPFWDSGARGDPLRSPMMKWRLRRVRERSACAMRMFMFWDPVTPDEARDVLGEELVLDRMLEVGFLRTTDEGNVVASFALKLADLGHLYIFCDDIEPGGDAAMGPSPATLALASFARPRIRTATALDLGCGPGTIALTMAPMCDRVIATDINPRAVALARLNASVNGIENVEFRTGDLFQPVAGETFDVIASQPPFVARPAGVSTATFAFGGDRGDELALRALGGLPLHLAPAGLGALMVVWPLVDGDPPLGRRLREALGPSRELSLLVLRSPGGDEKSIHLTCTAYAKLQNVSDTEAYDRDVIRFRDHFEQRRIRDLITTYVFVRRGTGERAGWTSLLSTKELTTTPTARSSVEMLFGAGDRAYNAASAPAASADGSTVSIELKTALRAQDALATAEYFAATGQPDQAFPIYRDLQRQQPTWRAPLLGSARIEIAGGIGRDWAPRLAPLARQGDREARRLLGDIHWKEDLEAALGWYEIEPRAPAGLRPLTAPVHENKVEVTRRRPGGRPFLLWVTCAAFDGSTARKGLRPDRPRLWDLAVNRFAASSEPVEDEADYVIEGGLSKLSCVKATIASRPGIFDSYRAVLLLDDDIGIDHEDVDRFFWLMSRYQLDLAHPSLSDSSHARFPAMYRQRESVVRFASTVDVRAPAFSRAALVTCIDSFDQSLSGEGLGSVWAHLLRHRRHAVGIVDAVAVAHLRPIDEIGGSFYQHLNSLGIDPFRERHDLHQRYGCPFVFPRTLGAVDPLGREQRYPE
ncbi:MAG TPA: methyltransferase [Polyangiaceae bacterium]